MVLQCVVHCPLSGCGSQIRKTSLPTSLGTGIASKLTSMLPDQIVWQPYEVELEDLLSWCIAGRAVWMATVPPVCFHLVELHTPNRVVRQFGMIQEISRDVDTDTVLNAIDLRGKVGVDWMQKHAVHIME